MPRYQVTGFLREAPFRGEYEVSTREEAIDRAYLATGPLLRLTEVCKLIPADMETRAATNDQIVEQAAEIRRLRAALDAVMDACDPECYGCGAYYVAKKALDGVKEKP